MTREIQDIEEVEGDVRDIAARWFARRRSGTMTEAETLALTRWLEEDAAHREAYLSVRRSWLGAGALRSDPQVLEMRQQWSELRLRRRRDFIGRLAVAGIAAVVLASAGTVGWRQVMGPHPLQDQAFQTAVGQRSTVTLPDGSELTLNTDTVVRTRADKDRRLVYLERGQVFFKVAKDARHPFVVTAAGKTVTALGTAFDVRVDASQFRVTLVEGRVRVEEPLPVAPAEAGGRRGAGMVSVQATDMTAGSQLIAPIAAPVQAPWRVASANVVVETSWTRDQLIFDDQPLGAVVAELNRYSAKKIILADPKLASTPVSGIFRPGEVDGFVRTVEAYRLARVGENTAEAVQLKAY